MEEAKLIERIKNSPNAELIAVKNNEKAIKEIISIVKNYNHEITIIECDDEI